LKNKISIIILSILFSLIIWISITLSDPFFSSEKFTVKVINEPDGYTYGTIDPETISIKLKAKGWQLLSLKLSSDLEFYVSSEKDSGRFNVNLYDELNENRWINAGINVLEINPREVSFLVEKIKFKKLKVNPIADITFSDGYGLATPISVYPDSVVVAGPSSIIDKMVSVSNKNVEVSQADQRSALIAELEVPAGFKLEKTHVQLVFDVQKIVEKSFDNIKVNVKDVPADKEIVLIPNIIECNIRGGINILGKINPEQIKAYINYSDIVYDTLGSIKPEIEIPVNTNLVYSKPEHLNYIIKKFK
jgi:hypothetical protein